MSFPSKFSSSASIVPAQTVRQVVQPHVVRSTISARDSTSDERERLPPGSQEHWNALNTIKEAYRNGQMSSSEYDAALAQYIAGAKASLDRIKDFNNRVSAGEAKSRDYYKEICGYSEEQTREWLQYRANVADSRSRNESQCRSRLLQNSKNGRGH